MKKEKRKNVYKHKFSLRTGEIIHVNGIPCEYLGIGSFGTNTYPGKPRITEKRIENEGWWQKYI